MAFGAWAQCSVSVSDTLLCTPGQEIVFYPEVSGYHKTQTYDVSTITFDPTFLTSAQVVPMSDDDVAGPFSIGFDFQFFGDTFQDFYIGSNGWLSFSAGQPVNYVPKVLPSNDNVPVNCIMGPWEDWDPSQGGQIAYQLIGTSPNRSLVVEFKNIPHFNCGTAAADLGYFQIVLKEGDYSIENHLVQKPLCDTVRAAQGIQNASATVAYTVSGRNSTLWSASYESVRYTPNNEAHYTWKSGSTVLSTVDSVLLEPWSTASYVLQFEDDAGCQAMSLFNVVVPFVQDPEIHRMGNMLECNLSGYSYQWYFNGFMIPGGTSQSVQLSSYGPYSVEVTDTVTGCVYSSRLHHYVEASVDELNASFGLYPNPSSSSFVVEFASSEVFQLRVFDAIGRLLLEDNEVESGDQLLHRLPPGAYHLELSNATHRLSKRLLVQ